MQFGNLLSFLKAALLLCLVGCGFFTDDTPPEETDLVKIEAIFGNKQFDPKKFYNFFEEPISEEIDYIEKRFYDYIKYVKRSETHAISRKDLKFFVSEFFRDQAEDFHRGIDTIFAVNSIVFDTGYDRLSLGNIRTLFRVLRHANIHFSKITRASQDYDAKLISLEDYKKVFRENLFGLSRAVINALSPNADSISAPIAPLIQSVSALIPKNILHEDTLSDTLSDIELVKVFIVGGDRERISLGEIRIFMQKVVSLALPLFDLYYLEKIEFKNDLESIQFIGERINALFDNLDTALGEAFSKHHLKKIFNRLSENFTSSLFNASDLLLEFSFLFAGEKGDFLTLKDIQRAVTVFYEGALAYVEGIERFKEREDNEDDFKSFRQWFTDKSTHLSKIFIANVSFQKQFSLPIEISLIRRIVALLGPSFLKGVPLEHVLKRTQLLKTLLAGGERGSITTGEVRILAQKAPRLSPILFDFLYSREQQLEKDFEYTKFVVERVRMFLGAIEEQSSSLLYPDELTDILPQVLGRWTSTDIIHLMKQYKTLILREGHSAYTYRNVKQAENTLTVYLESFILYEHTYKTIERILETKTATRDDIENLRRSALIWKNNIKGSLNLSLYPEEIMVEDFILQTWRELQFSETGTEKFLGILSSKKFLEATPKNILYKKEILSLIEKAPSVISGVITIIFNFTRENDPNKSYLSILQAIREIRAQLHKGSQNDIFMEMDDLDSFKPFFAKIDSHLIDLVKTLIPLIKSKIIFELFYIPGHSTGLDNPPGDTRDLTLSEFNYLFNIIDDSLIDLSLAGPTFDFYKEKLEVKTPIQNKSVLFRGDSLWPHRGLDAFSFFTEEQIDTFLATFSFVTLKYKYFRNDHGLHIYDRGYHRQKKGYIEILFFKKICTLLIKSYGRRNGRSLSLERERLNDFLLDFQPLLEYVGAWTENPATFSRNVLLLSDLFQHSSNGNNRIDIDEAVDFIGLTISAVQISKKIVERFSSLCGNLGGPRQVLINQICYRNHFFTTFFEDFPYLKDHLPKLYNYISNSSPEENYSFIASIEGFSRGQIDGPMTRHNFNRLLGALFNIESTFVRYDTNDNNILDQTELDDAFPTYKNAIYLLGKLDPSQEKLAKSVFLYIIKYNKLPPEGFWGKIAFFSFHLDRRHIRNEGFFTAKRLDIGVILRYIDSMD